jgi:catechol 2,3-dioxygenase-like lactoylglutathione lyase family enzyme
LISRYAKYLLTNTKPCGLIYFYGVFEWWVCLEVWLPRKEQRMMFGAHVIVSSKDAAADRAFLRDVLGLSSVDAGHGWLIFALPPAEVAVHPAEDTSGHELYFMCDDLKAEVSALGKKGVHCSEVQEARWGSITHIRLPGGGAVGLYQPKHPLAFTRSSS